MTDSPLARFYSALMKAVPRTPVHVIERWLRQVQLDRPQAGVVLQTHVRALERLAGAARQACSAAERAALETLLIEAQTRLGKAELRPASEDAERLYYPGEGPREMISPLVEIDDRTCPADILRLQAVAGTWSSRQLMNWLLDGLGRLEAEEGDPHLAFAPLKLYPLGGYLEQVAGAVLEALAFDQSIGRSLVQAIRDQLSGRHPAADRHRDAEIWMIYGELELADPQARAPTDYLTNVLARGDGGDRRDEAIDALCDAVFKTVPAPTRQAWFLELLSETAPTPKVIASLAIALLNEAAQDEARGVTVSPAVFGSVAEVIGAPSAQTDEALDRLLGEERLSDAASALLGGSMLTAGNLRAALKDRIGEPVPPPQQPVPESIDSPRMKRLIA